MTYKYSYKCLRCKERFTSNYPRNDNGLNICDECKAKSNKKKVKRMDGRIKGNNKKGYNQAKKAPKKVETEVIKEKNENLVNPNPDGYNRYKKNPNPPEPIKNQIEKFMELSDVEQKEEIGKLGNQLYMLKREIRPMLLRFNKFKAFYEAKHFGWDWSDEE